MGEIDQAQVASLAADKAAAGNIDMPPGYSAAEVVDRADPADNNMSPGCSDQGPVGYCTYLVSLLKDIEIAWS